MEDIQLYIHQIQSVRLLSMHICVVVFSASVGPLAGPRDREVAAAEANIEKTGVQNNPSDKYLCTFVCRSYAPGNQREINVGKSRKLCSSRSPLGEVFRRPLHKFSSPTSFIPSSTIPCSDDNFAMPRRKNKKTLGSSQAAASAASASASQSQ